MSKYGAIALVVMLGLVVCAQCACVGEVNLSQRTGAGSSWAVGDTKYQIFGILFYFILFLLLHFLFPSSVSFPFFD
jgi:hypothetical protein